MMLISDSQARVDKILQHYPIMLN